MSRLTPVSALQLAVDEIKWSFARANGMRPDKAPIWRVAIAVSGGVDSMALALAFASMKAQTPRRLFIRAFIVDHKAQEGSTQVAMRTARRLREIGLESKILTLKWNVADPAKLSNFEEQARALRYRAFAHACVGFRMDYLATAHHNDDMVENIVMGFSNMETGLSMRTIKSHAPIPESAGIYGADFSGILAREKWIWQRMGFRSHLGQTSWTSPPWTKVVEYGKLCLIRPLLRLGKQDLLELCQSSAMFWEEDATNADVTLTPRNAVRNFLSNDLLPYALRKESILQLAYWSQKRYFAVYEAFHFAERNCEIISLDIRSGVLKVRFVRNFFERLASNQTVGMMKHIAAGVLETFLQPVAPSQRIPHESLEDAVYACLPDLAKALGQLDHPARGRTSLTACGVVLKREFAPLQAKVMKDEQIEERAGLQLDGDHVWTLCRAPYRNGSEQPWLQYPGRPKVLAQRSAKSSSPLWSSWRLWDGRYWIQIKNRTRDDIVVRPFAEADLAKVKSLLNIEQYKYLSRYLNAIAPAKIRWTLPVIIRQPEDKDRLEEVIALPSLGKKGDFQVRTNQALSNIDWHIRYKHFSLRANGLEGRLERDAEHHVSLKYDTTAFKSWLDDDFLRGTRIARGGLSNHRPGPRSSQRPQQSQIRTKLDKKKDIKKSLGRHKFQRKKSARILISIRNRRYAKHDKDLTKDAHASETEHSDAMKIIELRKTYAIENGI